MAPLGLSIGIPDPDLRAAAQHHPNIGYQGLEYASILATSESSRDLAEETDRQDHQRLVLNKQAGEVTAGHRATVRQAAEA